MKSIRSIISGLFVLGGFVALSSLLHAEEAVFTDSIVQVTAEGRDLQRVSYGDLPPCGTFWLINSNGILSPDPVPVFDPSFSVYQISDSEAVYLVDATAGLVATDPELLATMSQSEAVNASLAAMAANVTSLIDQVQGAAASRALRARLGMVNELDEESGDGFTSLLLLDTNSLWLEITNYTPSLACLNLHNATNAGGVYAILSTTNLTTPFAGWTMERELWPVGEQTNVLPFTIATQGRQNLFARAEDITEKDSDLDGVPDWFAWLYWHTTNLPDTNLDYSGSGNTFAWDYSNNVTPTVFQFTGIAVTNNYVNNMSVPVQLDVAGTPYYLAISLDETNYETDATWNSYSSSNLTVNLGLTEGWHDVWIGLRGHGDDPTNAVWQWKRLKLDFTPPALIITGLTNGTVDVPVIQLTGYSPEALQSISYDLTNANGLVIDQPILITGQAFSTNTWEFLTNVFQGFDIPLTNGLNQITIHAMDMAGNVSTTNFGFTVDYSSKTNPPLVQVYWPLNGQKVCGMNFLCQGWVNDPTVSISAELVDTNNATNTFAAKVGRDGHFWLENLPLGGGTNWLTLTVTDVASNTFITNLIVLSGDAGLNIDPVSAGQTTVTGEILASNDTVWVNGVQATNNGDGTWTAEITPISGTGGAVEAVAIPNSDNNGHGSGGTDAAGNPMSAQGQSTQTPVNPPQGVYLISSTYQNQEDYWGNESITGGSSWADDTGGWLEWHSFDGSQTWDERAGWPTSPWPAAVPWGTLWLTNNGQFYGTTHRPASLSFHYASENVNAVDPVTGSSFTESAEGALKFAAGGELGSTVQRLYQFSGSVTIHHRPQPPDNDEVPWTIPSDDETVADGRVSLGNLGKLDTNGVVYALVTDNARVVVTPAVKGPDDYSFPSPGFSAVTLQSLTVVSNAVPVSGTNNWAAVKTNDYVYVKATLSTGDTNAAAYIVWSVGDPVAYDPFQRKVTKAASAMIPVTASLGSTNKTVNLWIIWATVSYQMSGSNPSNAPSFSSAIAGASNQLGVIYYDNTNSARGQVCIVGTVTPPGIHNLIGGYNWSLPQQRISHAFADSIPFRYDTDWTNDGPAAGNYTTALDNDDKIYAIDAPSIQSTGISGSVESYANFADYVMLGSQVCSDTNFWHWQGRWKADQTPQVTFTDLGTGLITLRTNSYY